MSYQNGFASLEEEEVLRVQVTGSAQDISLHQFVASQQKDVFSSNSFVSCDVTAITPLNGGFSTVGYVNRQNSSPSLNLPRRPRPLTPLNPLNLITQQQQPTTPIMASTITSTTTALPYASAENEPSSQPPPTASSDASPFLRRLDSFRRSSTEFTIANLRATYGISVPGSSSINSNLASAAAPPTNTSSNNVNPANVPDYDSDQGGNDPSLDPLAVRASTSSESQAIYGNEDIIKELRPDYARWFYKYESDRSWISFTGYDSIRMETRYRNLLLERESSGGGGAVGSYFYSAHSSTTTDLGTVSDSITATTITTVNNGYYYNNDHDQYHPDQYQHDHPSYGTAQYINNHNSHHQPHEYGEYTTATTSTNNEQSYHDRQVNECTESLNNFGYQHHYQYRAERPTNAYSSSEHQQPNSYYHHAPQQPHPHHHPQQFNNNDNNSTHPNVSDSSSAARFINGGGGGPSTSTSVPVVEGISPDSGPGGRNGEDDTCGENVIIVRGGLYEADLESWTCVATYWPGDKCQITRGTWFYDGTWQPLSVEHADKLEEEHLGQFSGVSISLFAQTNNGTNQPDSLRPPLHRVSFCEFHVDWTSPSEIHLISKAATYKFMRSVGQRLGIQTWGHRLCRGYFKPASKEDRPSEISHLVFVVHGIGQKMDTGRIVRNCASLRECVSSLKEKFFPHLNETKHRAEFFPVEWRSAAKLDGDVVDAITPHKLLSLRQLLNSTAMDIMYYTSPLYRTEIQNALRNELNRIYSNFVKRNPDFPSRGGKVSVIAHSLGAVITYDIITGYMPNSPDVPQCGHHNNGGETILDDQIKAPPPVVPAGLLFQLEHFFCLGSPLSVFLALRWRDPSNPNYRSYILPSLLCKRIYNIFYSTDPVAYRVEPLLNKYYVHIAPINIHTYGVLGRPKYDEMPRERINKESHFAKQSENPIQSTSSNGFNGGGVFSQQSTPQRTMMNLKSPPTPTKESNWGWATLMKYLKSSDPGGVGVINDGDELISPDGNSSPGREEGGNSSPEDIANEIPNDIEYRMDYVLKESNFTSTYLAALTSHTSYWSSPDTAFFVLTKLYEELLDIPSPPSSQTLNSAV